MDYLSSYIFPKSKHTLSDHLVLGVSLGGHAAWNCLLHEPRIRTAIVVIGCPDYINLMADRARLSKLPAWTNGGGSEFVGSEAFPTSLVETVRKYDPASFFLGFTDQESSTGDVPLRNGPLREPTEKEKEVLRPLLSSCLAGKRILNLAGGRDKLVPYHRGEAFLSWLKKAVAPDGWFGDGGVVLEDAIDQEAGHEVTPSMKDEAIRFIVETMVDEDGSQRKRGYVREVKL